MPDLLSMELPTYNFVFLTKLGIWIVNTRIFWIQNGNVLMCMRELCNCSHYWIHSFVFVKEETCLSVWRQLFYIVAKLRSFPLFYFLFLVTIKAFETFLNLSLYFLLIAVLLKKDYSLFTFPKICFHFQNGFLNELSFSKCGSFSKCAFIFKMWKI